MTTGYTSSLYEGGETSFPKFVMTCARGFGALVTMRDDPLDAPIPERFEASNYHIEELNKAIEVLTEVKSWGASRAEEEAEKEYQTQLQRREESIGKKTELRQRYMSMLKKVKAWIPPTADHKELKLFMIQQLESSIDFDCNYSDERPIYLSGVEFKQQKIEEKERDIAYHTKEACDEVERDKGRTEWVRTLRESLEVFEK